LELNPSLHHTWLLQNIGVDVNTGGVVDTYNAFVWEPSLVKVNALQSATEAACLILSVDETVRSCDVGHHAIDVILRVRLCLFAHRLCFASCLSVI
jgi:hypothetical protein